MNRYIHLKCWEITRCNDSECQARIEPEIPCWEIARRTTENIYNPYRICSECIVYLINHERESLSKEEIGAILKVRGLV